jgi:septation ring formation regulator EzrA
VVASRQYAPAAKTAPRRRFVAVVLAVVAWHGPPEEHAMAEENASKQLEHVTDTLTQLKEMHHYAKNNVERLTAIWLLFDGELSKLKQTDKIEDLMNRQGQLHDALEQVIADLEALQQKLQPPPESAG